MKDLKGKIALITGGTKGIGFGIAENLMNEGIHVAITGRDQQSADTAAEKLNKKAKDGCKAIGIAADVRKYDSQEKAVKSIEDRLGKIDFVIANAGLGHFGSVEDLSIEDWNETIETNLNGPFYTLKATLPHLIKNEGYFISISSLAGTNFFAGGAAYNASKFGLTGFTQAAMLDMRNKNVKFSTIMPGSVATNFGGSEGENDKWKIQPEDIGKLVVDLLTMHPRTLPSKIEVRPTVPKSS